MQIDNYNIGDDGVFVIAEIGNNHNGCIDKAKQLVDVAVSAGANCVKFQVRNMSKVYRKSSLEKNGEDLGTEYILDLLERFQLSEKEHREVREYCSKLGISYICTPWDSKSVDLLESFDVPAYKIASADLTNWPLIEYVASKNKPLILSTGMSSEDEIKDVAGRLTNCKASFALLHCNSTYPAPFADINLRWMMSLTKFANVVGYSGHERGIAVSLGAVGLGSKIIERHLTLDRNMEGPDHAASLEPEEFHQLVKGVRELELSLGRGDHRSVSQGEMINRENLSKSLVASKALARGHVLEPNDIEVKSPGLGLSPLLISELVGRQLKRDMGPEDYFFESDISNDSAEARDYSFSRPWGVPVRYHDFIEYHSVISPDLYEFHLSYSDMELDISKYLTGSYECDFVVHAPELFSQSRLMDLASHDDDYREFSIMETQRVIDITRQLKKFFPKTKTPLIVANIGGFTMDEPLPNCDRQALYEIFADSLGQLDTAGVELIPQTMAPFPWHFGGQRFQNLFIDADEIMEWCGRLKLRMCFDISHSKLACNQYGWNFDEFVAKVAPFTAHLHIGDASGVNGEGLQVGDGEVDFVATSRMLRKYCPSASFIPEIWQGHKNKGAGFWFALEKLENLL